MLQRVQQSMRVYKDQPSQVTDICHLLFSQFWWFNMKPIRQISVDRSLTWPELRLQNVQRIWQWMTLYTYMYDSITTTRNIFTFISATKLTSQIKAYFRSCFLKMNLLLIRESNLLKKFVVRVKAKKIYAWSEMRAHLPKWQYSAMLTPTVIKTTAHIACNFMSASKKSWTDR